MSMAKLGRKQRNASEVVATYQRDRLSLATVLDHNVIPMWTIVLNLLKNPSFLMSTMSITNVMFVLTAAQYWTTSYAT